MPTWDKKMRVPESLVEPRQVMSKQNPLETTQRIAAILRQRASPLAQVFIDGLDVRELPRHVREKIVDELGEEFSAKGLEPDSEPNAYGLELEALADACGLAWDDHHNPAGDRHDDEARPQIRGKAKVRN
jgi:hypothetical protein